MPFPPEGPAASLRHANARQENRRKAAPRMSRTMTPFLSEVNFHYRPPTSEKVCAFSHVAGCGRMEARRRTLRLGIDFGTTHTVVAFCDRGNYPVASFADDRGDAVEWFPSVVAER